jgi:apolipoprotein N-acyltransferase
VAEDARSLEEGSGSMIATLVSALLANVSLPTAIWTPWFSFQLPDLGFLAWVALVPFYLSLSGLTWRQGFRRGFVWGFVYFGVSFYWMSVALFRYGEAPWWGSLLGWLVAVVLISFFPACVAAVFCRFRDEKRGKFLFPLVWVSFEFLRNYFPFGGFPWSNLAYSQSSFLSFLQILDLFGVYGILYVLVCVNVALAEVWRDKRNSISCVGLAVLLVVISLVYGHFRRESLKSWADRPKMRVGLVQANIPQEQKWLEEKIGEIIRRHMRLTHTLENQKPDLIIWPEASYPAVMPPEFLESDLKIPEMKSLQIPLLMGVVRYEGFLPEDPEEYEKPDRTFNLFNSAVLINPGGALADYYDKVHLVPMGEYVPFHIPFLNTITPEAEDFTRGGGFRLMSLGRDSAPPVRFGVTICYEDLFPEISRAFAKQNPDFLVNLTNDGWYERSSAIFQHLDFSKFRAIETRRTMVRVTNTGVTAVFDLDGSTTATLPHFQEATAISEIGLGGPMTVYTRSRDAFAWGCVFLMVTMILGSFFDSRL